MIIAILAEDSTRQEILEKGIPPHVEVLWPDSVGSLLMLEADAWFDCQFTFDHERISKFKKVEGNNLFIGSNEYTCKEIGIECTRINDWPGFLTRDVVEIAASVNDPVEKSDSIFQGHAGKSTDVPVNKVLDVLNWKYTSVPDIEGFISSRIVAGIINEAYHTLEAGVSTKEEIDIAMKLGTNYPLGPFEWANKIGLQKVISLLEKLAHRDDRYRPADLMITENINKNN